VKYRVVSDDDVDMCDDVLPSGEERSPFPGPEATPRGKSTSSVQASSTHGSRSVSETGSKRGLRDSPGPSGTSLKRARGSDDKGKGKADDNIELGADLGGLVVLEDTPVDAALVPQVVNMVGYPSLLLRIS